MGSDPLHPLVGILSELAEVASHVDVKEMDALVCRMAKAKRIFVAGMGRSGLMARALAMRLMHLKMQVFVVGETTTPSIKRGDLLTTSSTPGHAMRCENRWSCAGAVVGKAMEPFEGKTGKITAMVTLA